MEKVKQKTSNGKMLNNIPFFAGLSDEDLQSVESHIRKKRIGKNEVVLFEEDTASYMYLVYSGKVRVVQTSEQGREHILTIHKKNDYFGEMALLDGKTSPATVIAMEESEIGLLGKQDFEHFLTSNDRIRGHIITMLCGRLREAWMMIKVLSFANAEERIMAVLDQLKNLNGVRDQRGVIITLKLTHGQIASYASVSRETATRSIKKLVERGMIEILDNRLILLKNPFFKNLYNAPTRQSAQTFSDV